MRTRKTGLAWVALVALIMTLIPGLSVAVPRAAALGGTERGESEPDWFPSQAAAIDYYVAQRQREREGMAGISFSSQAAAIDYYVALNAGDVEAALALCAADAVLSLGAFGSFSGQEELRGSFENEVAKHATWELNDFRVEGDAVTFTTRYSNDDLQAIGITLEGAEVITIRDGKIATDTWTVTEESMAALRAAMTTLP